jgi:uncharacterized membrane protein YjjB (DUF3815 family)
MSNFELVQIITGSIGSLCFGILFNLKGKRLLAGAIGGLLSWGIFVILSQFIASEVLNYFLVSVIVSIYAEIVAKEVKTPTTPIITTSLIPLIPGGSLYYTVASAFDSSFGVFAEKAIYTLKLASALALGMIIVLAVWKFLSVKIIRGRS